MARSSAALLLLLGALAGVAQAATPRALEGQMTWKACEDGVTRPTAVKSVKLTPDPPVIGYDSNTRLNKM